jgi:hypothetical protein
VVHVRLRGPLDFLRPADGNEKEASASGDDREKKGLHPRWFARAAPKYKSKANRDSENDEIRMSNAEQ